MERKFNGSYFKKYREKGGWTQLELAEAVNKEYKTHIVDVTSIARWEQNKNANPRNTTLVKVAKVLEIPVEALFDIIDTYETKEKEYEDILGYKKDSKTVAKHDSEHEATGLSVLEWNLHARGGSEYFFPKLVPETILRINADIVVLTEFFIGYNFDFFKIVENTYNLYISNYVIGKNQVAILVRKDRGITVSDVISINPLDNEKPEFLHIKLKLFGQKTVSIIGLRVKTEAKKFEEQIHFLDQYLEKLHENFICIGDFNARHKYLKDKFKYKVITPIHNKDKYHSINWIDNYSYFFPNSQDVLGGKADLDHAIINKGNASSVKYSWDFVDFSNEYPLKKELGKASCGKISVGYPDHAIFSFDYHFD